jgi:hypothetical protein
VAVAVVVLVGWADGCVVADGSGVDVMGANIEAGVVVAEGAGGGGAAGCVVDAVGSFAAIERLWAWMPTYATPMTTRMTTTAAEPMPTNIPAFDGGSAGRPPRLAARPSWLYAATGSGCAKCGAGESPPPDAGGDGTGEGIGVIADCTAA